MSTPTFPRTPAPMGAGVLLLTLAYCIKDWFGSASPAELDWILAPVAQLVQIVTGLSFHFDQVLGYINTERELIIAPACSGINFLLITWCMNSFQGLLLWKQTTQNLVWLGRCALLAYGATILVNTGRILISIWLYHHNIHFSVLTAERIHRITGVLIYYPALVFLFWMTAQRLNQLHIRPMASSLWSLALFPFFCYASGTIIIPFLARDQHSPLFWEHCLWVFVLTSTCSAIIAYSVSRRKKTLPPQNTQTDYDPTVYSHR